MDLHDTSRGRKVVYDRSQREHKFVRKVNSKLLRSYDVFFVLLPRKQKLWGLRSIKSK